ncbi:MAG: fructose-6-phosphate aldolase [Bacteroidetes bacterium]|nr:fructose-6-phosphate aldolase [Bacteroidota bacterium]
MKFFIDTANLSQIKEANDLGILDGVTTNPSLMAKEGIVGEKAIRDHYTAICNIVTEGDVSAEVLSTTYDEMVAEAQELIKIAKNIVVKVPCTLEGIKAIKKLTTMGIKTNCTLVFSVGQSLLAAKAGATYVSPFVGRIDDISSEGVDLVQAIVEMYEYYGFATQVLAASIRSTGDIIRCMNVGADVITAPLSSITKLVNHPLTDIGMDIFNEATKKMRG